MLQVGFIEYIVLPLWETWSDLVFPGAVGIVKNMERNRWWYEQHLPEADQPGGGANKPINDLSFDGFDEDHNFADERVYPLPGDEDDEDDDDLDDDSYEELLTHRRLPGGNGDADTEVMVSTQI